MAEPFRFKPTKYNAAATELELEGLDNHPAVITTVDLADTGLYPGYTYFNANTRTGWLQFIPGQVNILVSAYAQANTNFSDPLETLVHARIVFLDSGAISPLIAQVKDKIPAVPVLEWMDQQDTIIQWAHRMHQAGVKQAVVAALDLPLYDSMLEPVGITKAYALELTLRNAKAFAQAWYDGALPPGFKPVFSVQGVRVEEYLECMEAFDDFGILGMIRDGEAWLAVGGARDASPQALLTICRAVRERLGQGHIHGLGIGRQSQIVPLHVAGYIDGSDSSATTSEVLFNRGTYALRVDKLGRPFFLTQALWATNANHYEATLAAALEKARAGEIFEQGMLV